MRLILVLFFIIFQSTKLLAQTEYFVKIDLSTGKYKVIKKIPDVHWILVTPTYLTFDNNNQIYYFLGADAYHKPMLIGIDAATGKMLSNPTFPYTPAGGNRNTISGLQYDNVTKKLYGLYWNDTLKTEFLVSVNPNTATYSIIDSLPGVKWYRPFYTVFDERNHLYIFLGANSSFVPCLYSVDVTTGKIVSKPLFPSFSDPKDQLYDLQFNNTTHKLYSIYWNNSQKRHYLVSLDSGSAKVNFIDSLAGIRGVSKSFHYNTINENKNQMLFFGSDGKDGYLYSANLSSAKIVDKVKFTQLCNWADNLIELIFSKGANTLYGIHWENRSYFGRLKDTTVCPHTSLYFGLYSVPSGAKWSNGDTGQILYPKTSGYYSYYKINPCDSVVWADTLYITVKPGTNISLPADTSFCNESSVCIMEKNKFLSYSWSNGGNTNQICVSAPGKYKLTVTDTNKCKYWQTCNVNFYPSHKPILKDKIICNGDTTILFDTSSYVFTNYVWNQIDSTKFKTVVDPGIYILEVKDSNACNTMAICQVFFYPQHKPVVNSRNLCIGESTKLSDISQYRFLAYSWNNKETSEYITVKTPGTYILKTKDENACHTADTCIVKGVQPQKPLLGADIKFCRLDSLNLSEIGKGKFTSWTWNTGETKPAIKVKKEGSYILKTVDMNYCTMADTIKINFYPVHKPFLGYHSVICSNQSTSIKNLSGYNFKEVRWNTGEKKDSIQGIPGNKYIISVTDSNNCITKDSFLVIGMPVPFANFSFKTTCNSRPVLFTFTGAKPAAPVITNFKWDFAGQWTSTDENPVQIINNIGTHKVKLTLTSDNGCSDTLTRELEVKPNSKPDFSVADVCETDSARFINKSKDANTYKWKFGDASTSQKASPNHLYRINGLSTTFNVTLVAGQNAGCFDSITKSVNINANPVSDFTCLLKGNKIEVKAEQAGHKKYLWLLGNHDTAITTDVNYNYVLTKPDHYFVCLRVSNIAGCTSETCKKASLVGIKQNNTRGFKIYPNPNTGNFTIEIDNPSNGVSIEVYDLLGNLVKIVDTLSYENSYLIEMKGAVGIYLVKVKNGKMAYNQKVSIIK